MKNYSPILVLWLTVSLAADDSRLSFNRDVRPILSDKCFACHGPDEEQREADLRLDLREIATQVGSERPAIVPGQPSESELVARISSDDDSIKMPPIESGKSLTPHEIQVLRRWITQGAQYQGHWSFMPLSDVEPPPLDSQNANEAILVWPKNGVDYFIARRLLDHDLAPSPEADKSTLLRRVYLDLIGLLPTPMETNQFLQDDAPLAYERLVDRLLESPHYGERWGRHWLDQARYADSNGYTIDGERVMWPYRDWVIKALNEDLPFDQFTIEQLAGDLLPDTNKLKQIATGFHRNTLINQEGGTDPEQFRIEAVMDRVSTTGAVWLGLTVGCAQCHSHKFDPISHREYYELFAFFNHDADVNNVGPTAEIHEGELFVPKADAPQLARLHAAVAEAERLLASRTDRQRQWEQKILAEAGERRAPDELEWVAVEPVALRAEEAELKTLEDHSVLATQGVLREIYVIETNPLPPKSTIGSFQLRVIPHESLPETGPGLAANGNFVLSGVEIYLDGELLPLVSASATHAQPNYPAAALIDENPGTAWAINVADGSTTKMNAEHKAWLALGRAVDASDKKLRIVLKHELNNHYNVGRFQLAWSRDVADATTSPKFLEALKTPNAERTKQQQRDVVAAFSAVDFPYKNARSRVDQLRREIGLGPAAKSMVMQSLPKPRATYLFTRGDFLRPDKQGGTIPPGVPDVLPPLKTAGNGEPPNRLDLARWLTSPDNPLTPRVTVNRIWMRYFGRGIVETENDFGSQGSLPTHPDLLDWLARQLINLNWSQKQLHRLIVTSATYRQSSNVPSAGAAVHQTDSRNLLLSRQNRIRLDAEIIRDVALSASGRLNRTVGGPSVQPPQPKGVYAFTQNRKNWKAATDERRYRRAMYTMFYRSAPYPTLTTFDSPDFQSVCTARARSNTPLQALTMANDLAMFELAQGFAERVVQPSSHDAPTMTTDRINKMFRIAYARDPAPAESAAVQQFLAWQIKYFQSNPDAASAVAVGKDAAEIAATTERAAWTAIARSLMNTDEFITRE